MSSTHIPVPFFTDDIAIVPHSATDSAHLSKAVTIKQFANGGRVSLTRVMPENELLCEAEGQRFIQGPELKADS